MFQALLSLTRGSIQGLYTIAFPQEERTDDDNTGKGGQKPNLKTYHEEKKETTPNLTLGNSSCPT
jgi:hypothetical protein